MLRPRPLPTMPAIPRRWNGNALCLHPSGSFATAVQVESFKHQRRFSFTTMTRARSVWRGIVVVVRSGIAAWFIALVLQGIWSALIVGNLQTSPAIPWSVPVIVFLVLLAWRYLGGKWGPRSTAETRRRYLRANAVPARVFLWALLAGSLSIAA